MAGFKPNQARDKYGMWTTFGGGSYVPRMSSAGPRSEAQRKHNQKLNKKKKLPPLLISSRNSSSYGNASGLRNPLLKAQYQAPRPNPLMRGVLKETSYSRGEKPKVAKGTGPARKDPVKQSKPF